MKKPYPIRSILKACGSKEFWFRVPHYAKIVEVLKPVSWGHEKKYEIIVYHCLDKEGNVLAEIESDNQLVVFYGAPFPVEQLSPAK